MNELKILEKQFDEDGNLSYVVFTNGESWYDKNGNEIRFKDSNGKDQFYDYDDRKNVIHSRIPKDNYEEWFDYDDLGRFIHVRSEAEGKVVYEESITYEGNDVETHKITQDGVTTIIKYMGNNVVENTTIDEGSE